MKTILLASFVSSFIFLGILSGCSKTPEKPKLTLSEYSKQAVITKGVVEKILAEPDYKKMHEIALAVESARAVNCITISEECNYFGKILNKIVQSTQTRLPNAEENVEIYRLLGEMDSSFTKGYEILARDWNAYIAATHPKEENSEVKK